jgi:(1->4)-alpha-D-glucan 1-alpha-D-glucosylmutase
VRLTAPGVPDIYQGTEAFRFLLVDPDNRAEPDQAELDAIVAEAASVDGPAALALPGGRLARAVVVRRCLAAKRDLGAAHGYQPLTVVGPDAADVIAFARRGDGDEPALCTVIGRRGLAPVDAVVAVPGCWRSLLDDAAPPVVDALDAGAALARFPACVLVPEGSPVSP